MACSVVPSLLIIHLQMSKGARVPVAFTTKTLRFQTIPHYDSNMQF